MNGREITHPKYLCKECCCPGIHALNAEETQLAVIGDLLSGPYPDDENLDTNVRDGEAVVVMDMEILCATVAANAALFKAMCAAIGNTYKLQNKRPMVAPQGKGRVAIIGKVPQVDELPGNVRAKVGAGEAVVTLSARQLAFSVGYIPALMYETLHMFGCDCESCAHKPLIEAGKFLAPDAVPAKALEAA